MSKAAPQRRDHDAPAGRILLAVGLISAALIAYEIVLMRRLLIERWHHFGYLVISAALLGFGGSGTLLAIFARRVRARPGQTVWWCTLGTLVLLLVMPRVAAQLPVAARFIPGDLWRQAGWWSLYWLAALGPFLLGAMCIGAVLMTAGTRVGQVYASNLFGSAVGAVGAALVVSRLPIEFGLWPSLVAMLLALLALSSRRLIHVLCVAALAAWVTLAEVAWPLPPDYDEHKYAARVQQLVAQGSARRVARAADPHGCVEVYESELFHDLPFLALTQRPPAMMRVLVNGDPAGSVLKIRDAGGAGVMDGTLMAFPYRLLRAEPRVLLVGESGGANVWLARRRDARAITVVQPNAAIVRLLSNDGPLVDAAGEVFDASSVHVVTSDPRWFLSTSRHSSFDLVQIVALEGLGTGGAGMRGLAEDHLATVEGFAACLRVLDEGGALAISRGLQQPERENIRILATLVAALEHIGVNEPARHIVQVRDYLGACTIALKSPLDEPRRDTLRTVIREFNLTPVWYDGLPVEEVNQPDAMPGPPGSEIDWLHHAAREIFSPRRDALFDAWLLNVRPPSDDSPFFWDFCKPGAIATLKQAYGPMWLTRAELGRLFLYASLAITGVAAVVLILLPLAVWQFWPRPSDARLPAPRATETLWTILYFAAIGLGFMGIEMALISRAIRLLGDPVIASAAVIGGVLLVSGVGSLTARRVVSGRAWFAPALVVAFALALRWLAWTAPDAWADTVAGAAVTAALAAVLAYFMGMPMPTGLALLDERAESLVPWAWGVNGVASVLATSLAIVLAMSLGYSLVMSSAAALYAVAAASLVLFRLGRT